MLDGYLAIQSRYFDTGMYIVFVVLVDKMLHDLVGGPVEVLVDFLLPHLA